MGWQDGRFRRGGGGRVARGEREARVVPRACGGRAARGAGADAGGEFSSRFLLFTC